MQLIGLNKIHDPTSLSDSTSAFHQTTNIYPDKNTLVDRLDVEVVGLKSNKD
jgi:hypothetical protein